MFERLPAKTVQISVSPHPPSLLDDVGKTAYAELDAGETPVRFAVTQSNHGSWHCEVGVQTGGSAPESIFRFAQRSHENSAAFNAVMLVPTGIGAEIGGHATPVAALMASVYDSVITHPNVLNASDLIQIPSNAFYVEGSIIARVRMGTSKLLPVRSNRILVLIQSHEDEISIEAAINAVNAARACYGLVITDVVLIDPRFRMVSEFSPSGAAVVQVHGIEHIWSILDARIGEFDAVAISSVIEVPFEFHKDYYECQVDMVNSWGGVEAMLTYAISLRYSGPAAHSPMFESREVADLDVGVVDPRMAAEVISLTFFQSVLKGLQNSPRIITRSLEVGQSIGADNISCLVIPDRCLGLPVLAALKQGIPVVAVRENSNLMQNELSELPWERAQFIVVENYWEVAGVLASQKAGLDPHSVRRPMGTVNVSSWPNCLGSIRAAMSGAQGGRSCM